MYGLSARKRQARSLSRFEGLAPSPDSSGASVPSMLGKDDGDGEADVGSATASGLSLGSVGGSEGRESDFSFSAIELIIDSISGFESILFSAFEKLSVEPISDTFFSSGISSPLFVDLICGVLLGDALKVSVGSA